MVTSATPRRVRRGFQCPFCYSPMRPQQTRRPAADLVVRNRKCANAACGHRVLTEERIAPRRKSKGDLNRKADHDPVRPGAEDRNARPSPA